MALAVARRNPFTLFAIILLLSGSCLFGQSAQPAPAIPASPTVPDYSGMYAFLREGEFVQLNVENDGRLTGFVSRYGDSESDRGVFLEQFFKQAKLDGNKVSFTTAVVHGVFFDFKGTIERGGGKSPDDEAYYILKGTITESTTDADKKTISKSHDAAFKSFPRDLASPQ